MLDEEGHQDSNKIEEVEDEHVLDGDCSDGEDHDHLNFVPGFVEPNQPHHLYVVRCALSLPQQEDDWRRITILQFLIQINDKFYKVLVDSGSSINAISQRPLPEQDLRFSHTPDRIVCLGSTPPLYQSKNVVKIFST